MYIYTNTINNISNHISLGSISPVVVEALFGELMLIAEVKDSTTAVPGLE